MSGESVGDWIELTVEADVEAVEPVVELFSRYGYQGGVAIEEPFTQDPDGDNLAIDIARPFTISTYMRSDAFTPALKEDLEQRLWFLGTMRPVGSLEVRTHRETDWEEAWKKHFTLVQASDRVLIRAPWHEIDDPGDALVITLDPGMAFGTGTHPTTRLCLQLLEQLPVERANVLDAGTGTGVLAIAAVMMGAKRVLAVDIDEIAVRQSIENVELNGLSNSIDVELNDLATAPEDGPFDVVIANIISRILVEVHEALIQSMTTGGVLLLSGIIEDKEQSVIDCYESAGLTRVERRQMGDWIAHVWKRL